MFKFTRLFPALAACAFSAIVFGMSAHSAERPLPAEIPVRFANADGTPGPVTTVPTIHKTEEEWKKQLGPQAYSILRSESTERPFCGLLLDNKKAGVYFCAGCDLPLFSSNSKFHSGTGWPSFFEPFAKENVGENKDVSYGMVRTEIFCARCGGHLGHVFEDGPKPTGLRFCLNSEAMIFRSLEELKK